MVNQVDSSKGEAKDEAEDPVIGRESLLKAALSAEQGTGSVRKAMPRPIMQGFEPVRD